MGNGLTTSQTQLSMSMASSPPPTPTSYGTMYTACSPRQLSGGPPVENQQLPEGQPVGIQQLPEGSPVDIYGVLLADAVGTRHGLQVVLHSSTNNSRVAPWRRLPAGSFAGKHRAWGAAAAAAAAAGKAGDLLGRRHSRQTWAPCTGTSSSHTSKGSSTSRFGSTNSSVPRQGGLT